MVSFLASPKPFAGAARDHQHRAIQSWLTAHPEAEVILYGDADGIDEAGRQLGAKVVRGIECSPARVPYFGAIAAHAAAHARHDLQVYVNCDIVLAGILPGLRRVEFPEFLMVGQRIDLAEGLSVDVTQAGWKATLQQLAQEGKATLHGPTGTDYFGFRRGLWTDIPRVAIGRAGYDHALLAYCLCRGVPIVDATLAVVALHPFHDYGHVPGGWKTVWTNEDAQNNLRHAGGSRSRILISDADHVLTQSGLRPWPCRGDRLRRLELALRYRRGWPTGGMAVRLVWRIVHGLGAAGVTTPTLEEVIRAHRLPSGDLTTSPPSVVGG